MSKRKRRRRDGRRLGQQKSRRWSKVKAKLLLAAGVLKAVQTIAKLLQDLIDWLNDNDD